MGRVVDYRTLGTVSGASQDRQCRPLAPAYFGTSAESMEDVEERDNLDMRLYREADDSTQHPHDTESLFAKLAANWKEQSRFMSSPAEMANLASYRQIIAIGQPAVPLLLEELKKDPDHWFWALWLITGENPVREEWAGDVEMMASAWLAWGKQQGYIS
jgi:hypothetical protein